MKIICDSQQEYDDLMEASKYLHDYDIENPEAPYLDQDIANGMVGRLFHLYREVRNEDKVPSNKLTVVVRGG